MKLSRLRGKEPPTERIHVKKVSDAKVELPKKDSSRKYPVLGSEYCADLYGNIFFAGRKMSGKTTALITLLKRTTGQGTTYIIFSGSLHDDDLMVKTIEYLRGQGRKVITHTSTYEKRDGVRGEVNLVKELLEYFQTRRKPEVEDDPQPLNPIEAAYGEAPKYAEVKVPERQRFFTKKKGKDGKMQLFEYPEFAIVLDDVSGCLRKNRAIVELIKIHRHIGSKVFVNSQYLVDVPVDMRKNMDLIAAFRGLDDKRLDYLYADSLSDLHPSTFQNLYRDFTREPHSFMLIDTKRQKYKKNFDHEAVITRHNEQPEHKESKHHKHA